MPADWTLPDVARAVSAKLRLARVQSAWGAKLLASLVDVVSVLLCSLWVGAVIHVWSCVESGWIDRCIDRQIDGEIRR